MKVSLTQASLLLVGQLLRQHGEAETPTSNQSPRVDQGHWLSHAAGRRQASLGTAIPRTPTVAPGPKACSDLA